MPNVTIFGSARSLGCNSTHAPVVLTAPGRDDPGAMVSPSVPSLRRPARSRPPAPVRVAVTFGIGCSVRRGRRYWVVDPTAGSGLILRRHANHPPSSPTAARVGTRDCSGADRLMTTSDPWWDRLPHHAARCRQRAPSALRRVPSCARLRETDLRATALPGDIQPAESLVWPETAAARRRCWGFPRAIAAGPGRTGRVLDDGAP